MKNKISVENYLDVKYFNESSLNGNTFFISLIRKL